jgi:hypothetical protein
MNLNPPNVNAGEVRLLLLALSVAITGLALAPPTRGG